ncbi:hypothetical protein L1049_024917 [Liquidambar formosana]|uniref:RING-type domain-containing protein n=1 Tax=Liquidambar formosana TaxID=63359 RepID=A0AAP0RWH7_LIQFO
MDGLSQLKLHFSSPPLVILTRTSDSSEVEWWLAFSFVARLIGYLAILALLVIVLALIFKYLGECDCQRTTEEVTEGETNPLWPEKATPCTYGTCQEDLESGNCTSSSSEDLYDGKICVICYDEQRNCFFVPCGHCATCYVCAQRIFDGENKTCPVCRRFIRKVRKLFTSQS